MGWGARAPDGLAGGLGEGVIDPSAPPVRDPSQWREPWDPWTLTRIRHLHLEARRVTDALLLGSHRSRRLGEAVEFAGHQDYGPDQDPRRIDWRVWGRSDRLVVKQFEAETQHPVVIVLDLSGDASTGQGGGGVLPELGASKAGAAVTLAATVAYWLHLQGEPVGLSVIAGAGVASGWLPPRGGRAQLQQIFLTLARARPEGRASLGPALITVASRVRRRSKVIVISDAMEEPESWLPALTALGRRGGAVGGTDLRFVHVWDPQELTLAMPDAVKVYSPEGGDDVVIDPAAERAAFVEVADAFLAEVRAGVTRAGGQYVAAPTSEALDRVVRRLVSGRTVGRTASGAELPAADAVKVGV
jgi:uncharacterized protein (DUF58 family)